MKLKLLLLLLISISVTEMSLSQTKIDRKVERSNKTRVNTQTQHQLVPKIKLMSPSDKEINNGTITFMWDSPFKKEAKLSYELTILSINPNATLKENIKKNNVYHKEILEGIEKFTLHKIDLDQAYIWSVKARINGEYMQSDWWTFFPTNLKLIDWDLCENNVLSNNGFENGKENWEVNQGSPQFIQKVEGCDTPGYVKLKVYQEGQDIISQKLSNSFRNQRHYKVSFCLQNGVKTGNKPIIKILAYNGSLANANLSSQTALIYSSGEIPYFEEWSSYDIPSWTATNNFDHIAFYIINNSTKGNSEILLDNICVVEVASNNCEEEIDIKIDKEGNYEIIDSQTNSLLDFRQSEIVETHQDYSRGNITDLYGSIVNTSVDDFYENIDFSTSCYSIGEYDPTDDFANIDQKIDSTQFANIIEHINKKARKVLNDNFLPDDMPAVIDVGPANDDKICNTSDANLPFGGADIIYVHGLATAHLLEALSPNQIHKKFRAEWPADKREFYTGDYKQYADEYWKDHIQSQITDSNGNLTNRYMTVAWPSDQRLGDGIHAALTQIADAINSGVGVKANKDDPRGFNCFGNKIVIVSHSTGGLLVSSMLGLAELSRTAPDIQNKYGLNLFNLVNRVQVHIALAPALSGSKLATLAVVAPKILGNIVGAANPLAGLAANHLVSNYSDIIDSSVLIDLIPPVSQYYWGNTYYDKARVSTITLAGSTPGLPQGGAMGWAGKFLIQGYNDGVLGMDCACGSNQEWFVRSSYLIDNPLKMIDFGNPYTTKAMGLGYDSRFNRLIPLSPVRISACTPYLTPAGMITPFKSNISGIKRWPNHYSMIQTTMSHFDPTENIITLYPNYNQSVVSNINNYEEVRVVTNDYIYTSGLVSSNFKNMVNEHVRKKTIGFHFPALRRKQGFPYFEVYWKYYEIVIWKRTYHLLQDYQNNNGVDYMYSYILR